VIRLDPSIYRQNIIEELAIQGIPSAAYSLPIHLQPFMVERFGYRAGDFSETEMMARRVLALPFSGSMTEKQVDSICKSLKQILS
jgi:dTDP-4-amino-4,6-dideoxygalactose transaminase